MAANMEGDWNYVEHLAAEKPIVFPPGSTMYKRTFTFDSDNGQLNVIDPIIAEELLLKDHSVKYHGLKLLRGMWHECVGDSSATYFPLAAVQGEITWCSAGHCLLEPKQYKWHCKYGQIMKKGSTSPRESRRKVVDLSWLAHSVAESELLEFKPSQPDCPIPFEVVPDIGFMQTSAPNLRPQQLFVPCADEPDPQQPVCIIGFASRPNGDWAATFLRTAEDYEAERETYQARYQKDPPDTWVLDVNTALRRALDLIDDVCHPSMLAVAPGQVVKATTRIVEHTCSTFPGMSGAPGVDIRTPWKLLFVHTRADRDWRRNLNYGISVNNALFVKAYVREVLPKVLTTPRAMFEPGMMQCLQQYLIKHETMLEDRGVLDTIAKLI